MTKGMVAVVFVMLLGFAALEIGAMYVSNAIASSMDDVANQMAKR